MWNVAWILHVGDPTPLRPHSGLALTARLLEIAASRALAALLLTYLIPTYLLLRLRLARDHGPTYLLLT